MLSKMPISDDFIVENVDLFKKCHCNVIVIVVAEYGPFAVN